MDSTITSMRMMIDILFTILIIIMISLKMDIVNNNINDYVYNHSYHSYNWYLLTNKTETNIIKSIILIRQIEPTIKD